MDSKYASKEEIIEINKLIYTVIYIFASIFHKEADHTKEWCPEWSPKKSYMLGRLIWLFFDKTATYDASHLLDNQYCKNKELPLHRSCNNLSDFWGEPLDPINFMIFILNNLFNENLTYIIEDDNKYMYKYVENGIKKEVKGWTVIFGTKESLSKRVYIKKY